MPGRGDPLSVRSIVRALVLVGLLAIAGSIVGAAAGKGEHVVLPFTPHRLQHVPAAVLAHAPHAAPAGDGFGAAYAFVDGAGIAGVDTPSGGPLPANFVHLEDPLVCGAPCLVPTSSFGDEGTLVFCPPAGDPNMPWRWSSGISSQGIAGCTTTAQGAWFVNTNGFVGPISPACSGTTGNCWTPVAVPTTGTPNGQVYANWQDYDNSCSVAPNGFYVGYGGTAPNRFIIFEWFNVKSYPCASSTTTQTFEVIVFEIDHSVEVYYGTGSQTIQGVGGEENNGGNAGLQYFRTTATPQNLGIVYFDAVAPVVTNLTATCASPGLSGWCKSSSVTGRVTDNNDVGFAGRVGFGIKDRTRSIDGGPAANYTNNTSFPLTLSDGTHTLVANASDWGLNTGGASVTIKVDSVPPVLEAAPDVSAEATGPGGAPVTYLLPAATDATSGPGPVSCAPASGSTFPLGATTVSCSVSDLAGNGPVARSFVVRVVDTTPPTVEQRAALTAEAAGPNGASVAYTSPASHDLVSGSGTSSCSPASGSNFPRGTSSVSCSATDAAGNIGTGSFQVHVVDTTAPTVDARPDETAEATGPGGAVVIFAAPASHDAVDGDGTSACDPPPGSTFPLGTTFVVCTATDSSGNAGSSTFRVRVVDTTGPVIDAHGTEIAEATGPGGASVAYTSPTARDAVEGDAPASCSPASGSTFPVGTSTVTCVASDSRGNSAQPRTFSVLVRDTTPPVISARADVLADASGLAGAIVTYSAPSTSDVVDGAGVATCAPSSGSLFPLGSTVVTCAATDAAGNAATPTTFRVIVTLQVRVHVQMERAAYGPADALADGVGGNVLVTAGDGTPLAGVQVRVVVSRIAPVVGALDDATLGGVTDSDGRFTFRVGPAFALPGDYLVDAASITSGLEGTSRTSYTVGLGVGAAIAAAPPPLTIPIERPGRQNP